MNAWGGRMGGGGWGRGGLKGRKRDKADGGTVGSNTKWEFKCAYNSVAFSVCL